MIRSKIFSRLTTRKAIALSLSMVMTFGLTGCASTTPVTTTEQGI